MLSVVAAVLQLGVSGRVETRAACCASLCSSSPVGPIRVWGNPWPVVVLLCGSVWSVGSWCDAEGEGAAGDAMADGAACDVIGEVSAGDVTGDGAAGGAMATVLQEMQWVMVLLVLPMLRVLQVMQRVMVRLVLPMVAVLQVMQRAMVPLVMPMVRVLHVRQRVTVPLVMRNARLLQVMHREMVLLMMPMVRVVQVMPWFLGTLIGTWTHQDCSLDCWKIPAKGNTIGAGDGVGEVMQWVMVRLMMPMVRVMHQVMVPLVMPMLRAL